MTWLVSMYRFQDSIRIFHENCCAAWATPNFNESDDPIIRKRYPYFITLVCKHTKKSLAAEKQLEIKLERSAGPDKSKLDQFRPKIEALLLSGSSHSCRHDLPGLAITALRHIYLLPRLLKRGRYSLPPFGCNYFIPFRPTAPGHAGAHGFAIQMNRTNSTLCNSASIPGTF